MANEPHVEKREEGKEATPVERTRSGSVYQPNVDIIEKDDELTLLADVPGVKSDDVEINFDNGTLTVDGKVQPRQAEGTSYLLREYGIGDFHRSFQVSEAIDVNGVTAELSNGVLVLHLPKVEAAKPRKISVQVK